MELRTAVKGDLKKMLQQDLKQLRYASAVALSRSAQRAKRALVDEMQKVFDRPTRWTLNSVYVSPATVGNLNAAVYLRPGVTGGAAAKYLLPQIEGGGRDTKRFEKSLAAAGLLPQGWYAVPGDNAQLDGAGNMSRGQIVKILSALRASRDSTQNAAPRADGRSRRGQKKKPGELGRGKRRLEEYFAVGPGHGLPPGIYQRKKRRDGRPADVLPVIIYVKKTAYRARFDFYRVAQEGFESAFGEEFEKAMAAARATAK